MRTMKLGTSSLEVPVIAVGCMGLNSLSIPDAERFLRTALEHGVNFFDHADVYHSGDCERVFAQALHMNDDVREKVIIQGKVGIWNGYNSSREHLTQAVEGTLKRLQTDYLDVLLIHRPDPLVEPEEVAETFDALYTSGKVRNFGVSNHNGGQIALLQKFVKQPIVANQLQFSAAHAFMISRGVNVNMNNEAALDRDGGVLDFCRLHDITIQPWSPFRYGFFEGVFLGNKKYPKLNETIRAIANKYGVTDTTIAIAWILRHPAHMQPISGTVKTSRLKEICKAADITLTRDEWYDIFRAAGNQLP